MKKGKIVSLKSWKKARSGTPVKVYDYAGGWKDLSKKARIMYAWGLKDGFTQGCFDLLKTYEGERGNTFPHRKAIEDKVLDVVCLDPKVLADKMTKLYRKPWFRTLPFNAICAGALSILEGASQKEVEKDLEILIPIYNQPTEPTE